MTPLKSAQQKYRSVPPSKCAFTRADLLVTLGVLALLALVVLPALANQRPRSARIVCANNLRQIGLGFQLWGNDHADTLPQETSLNAGGTMAHPLSPNVWLHLSWISNEVATPAIFLCPSDSGRAARDFSFSSTGGYDHPNFANRASSYFLGYTGFSIPNAPGAAIAGDRNVITESVASCSRFLTALSINSPPDVGVVQWTKGLHNQAGNVLSFDGRVQQLDSPGLRKAFDIPNGDNARKHIITPR